MFYAKQCQKGALRCTDFEVQLYDILDQKNGITIFITQNNDIGTIGSRN
jgi:hypothetical protein